MADLFISYAREDRELAKHLADILEGKGFITWYDTSLSAGLNFSREIQRQIDQSNAVLVIWTDRSAVSDWVLAEVQRAYAREKLICIKDRHTAIDSIPLPYNALHCIGIDNPDELLDSLRKRAIHPSRSERSWPFYEEAPETRRRVMTKFSRIAESYKSTGQLSVKDPSLDVRIEHDTLYEFDREVRIVDHTLRLHPILQFNNFRDYTLSFLEPPDINETAYDLFDNVTRRVAYQKPLRKFGFKVSMIVNLTPINPFGFYSDEKFFYAVPVSYREVDRKILQPYLEVETDHASFVEFASSVIMDEATCVDAIVRLLRYVQAEIANEYDPSRTTGRTRTIADILSSKRGTSGELSVVLTNLLRYYGFAARFASGYLIGFPDVLLRYGPGTDWEVYYSGWVQTYVPGGGWIGLDPMTGLLTQENFVPLACGPRLSDTMIVEGYTEVAAVSLAVNSRAAPVHRALRLD